MHILLVEDDLDLGRALLQGLKAEAITGQWVRRVVDAPYPTDTATFDCLLLDVSLPDGTGYDLLSQWRRAGVTVPIIIIIARSALEERLIGLNAVPMTFRSPLPPRNWWREYAPSHAGRRDRPAKSGPSGSCRSNPGGTWSASQASP